MSEPSSQQFKAFLFDLDGTLVDSNHAHAEAWANAFAAEGLKVSLKEIRSCIGMGADHLLKKLLNIEAGSDQGKKLSAERDDIFKTQYLQAIKAFDGASDLLRELHDRGFRLILASSGSIRDTTAILKNCGLETYFDGIVNVSNVDSSKPDADIIQLALEMAEADPHESVMVGDTPYDCEAAQRAGVTMFAFTCGGWSASNFTGAVKIASGPREVSDHLDSILLELHGSTSVKTARKVTLTESEESEVEEHVSQRTPVIFEIIRREGNEELNRPLLSLCASGLTAGLSMGLSVLAQAFISQALPHQPWAELISKLGYSVGFLIVILAHQQLFTENTLTAVVPLLAEFSRRKVRRVFRLWSTVLIANVLGTFLFSVFALYSGAFTPDLKKILIELSVKGMDHAWAEFITRGILAGFLVASLVWILANVSYAKFALIILMTYLLALMDLSHIVAGSVEASLALFTGSISLGDFSIFFFSTLTGNILGGSALFALLSYAQIHAEIRASD